MTKRSDGKGIFASLNDGLRLGREDLRILTYLILSTVVLTIGISAVRDPAVRKELRLVTVPSLPTGAALAKGN